MHAAFKLLALLAALLLPALMLAAPASAGDSIAAPEALTLVQARAVLLVDVRTPVEWSDTGIPVGAATVSWGQPDFIRGILALTQGDRHAPLLLICRTGNRSGRALATLRENGFTQVSHVAEGMAGGNAGPGWLARGLPVKEWQAN